MITCWFYFLWTLFCSITSIFYVTTLTFCALCLLCADWMLFSCGFIASTLELLHTVIKLGKEITLQFTKIIQSQFLISMYELLLINVRLNVKINVTIFDFNFSWTHSTCSNLSMYFWLQFYFSWTHSSCTNVLSISMYFLTSNFHEHISHVPMYFRLFDILFNFWA